MSRGAPKFATRRTPANPSLGAVVGHVSKAVRGKTLMPWQQAVADVGCELNPDYPGEWRYDTVIVTVPRQAGKSDLLGAIHTHRLIAYRNHLAVMTAQTGKDAGKRWRAIAKDIPKDDAARLFEIKRGKGAEYIEYLPSGSSLSPFAPTASAVHGDSLNLATIDEGWAFTEAQGRDVEGAIKPTFATIVNSQLWIVSTRGTANSEWLNNKIALGRASVGDPVGRRGPGRRRPLRGRHAGVPPGTRTHPNGPQAPASGGGRLARRMAQGLPQPAHRDRRDRPRPGRVGLPALELRPRGRPDVV